MNPSLYIFVSAVFTLRDHSRMGVSVLSKNFNVIIADISPILYPEVSSRLSSKRYNTTSLNLFHCSSDLDDFILSIPRNTLFLDYMSNGNLQSQIRRLLALKQCKRIKVFAGSIPVKPRGNLLRSSLIRSRDILKSSYFTIRSRLSPVVALPTELPAISIWSSVCCRFQPLAQSPKKIFGHNLDYDLYLQHRYAISCPIKSPFFLFLDQNLYNNHDQHVSKLPPVVSENYFHNLNILFNLIEKTFKIPVIIAGHPKAEDSQSLFSSQILYNITPELIRDCLCVLAHYSAAINLAVLFKKPIHILTSEEIQLSPVWKAPLDFASALKCPVHFIESSPQPLLNAISLLSFNEKLYDSYKKYYIKMPGSPELPLWEYTTTELVKFT